MRGQNMNEYMNEYRTNERMEYERINYEREWNIRE
jgi:hypothetical protein